MLATRIIPTLLVRGGALYKGEGFDSWRQVGHPAQATRIHQARGVDELIVLDISATPEKRGPDIAMVERLAEECFMPITFGGGVKHFGHVRDLLSAGADKVSICSAALYDPGIIPQIAGYFGRQALVVAIDIRAGRVASDCGAKLWDWNPIEWAREVESLGAGEILLTSIERDGKMTGYDLDLIRFVSDAVSIPVIASGGCGSYQHMLEAVSAGASAVAAGAFFHFCEATPHGAAEYLNDRGVETRT